MARSQDPNDAATLALHEELLLLILDDDRGTSRGQHAELALAGAVLVDLARGGAVTVDGTVRAAPAALTLPGVLGDAVEVISAEPKARDPEWWVNHLPDRLKPFIPRLAARLVAAGVLVEQRHTFLGLFSRTRLPERDHAPEARVRERLRAVLLGAEPADRDDAVLAALVGAVDLVGTVVDKPDRARAKRRAAELARGDQVGEAVRAAIKAAQDAVMVAIIASTAATSAATS